MPPRALRAEVDATPVFAGELQRLVGLDIDLAGGWIHIISRPCAETKTDGSHKVPIHPRLRTFLEAVPVWVRTWFFEAPPSKIHPAGGNSIVKK